MIYTDTVTVVRPRAITDEYSDELTDWAGATRTTVSGVSVQPLTQTEPPLEHRTVTLSRWRVITDYGVDVDVLPTDRVELADGTVCEVDGVVARWADLSGGGVDHVEFVVQRIGGS